jgi:hypothetical protein
MQGNEERMSTCVAMQRGLSCACKALLLSIYFWHSIRKPKSFNRYTSTTTVFAVLVVIVDDVVVVAAAAAVVAGVVVLTHQPG